MWEGNRVAGEEVGFDKGYRIVMAHFSGVRHKLQDSNGASLAWCAINISRNSCLKELPVWLGQNHLHSLVVGPLL